MHTKTWKLVIYKYSQVYSGVFTKLLEGDDGVVKGPENRDKTHAGTARYSVKGNRDLQIRL